MMRGILGTGGVPTWQRSKSVHLVTQQTLTTLYSRWSFRHKKSKSKSLFLWSLFFSGYNGETPHTPKDLHTPHRP